MEIVTDLYYRSHGFMKRHLLQTFKSFWKTEDEPRFRLSLVTGDKKGAGTDANVYIIIHDSSKTHSSKVLRPQHALRNDFERGSKTQIEFGFDSWPDSVIPADFDSIEIWRDDFWALSLPFGLNQFFFGGKDKDMAHWFLDRVELSLISDITDKEKESANENKISSKSSDETGKLNNELVQDTTWVFPVHRWIKAGQHYFIPRYDSLLPQHDDRKEFRQEELKQKKKQYRYAEKVKGGPIQVEELPSDEKFSHRFFWTFVEKKASLMTVSKFINWTTSEWTTLDDIKQVFKACLKPPQAVDYWKEDWWFGHLRVQGVESTLIRLCEAVPRSIPVPDNMPRLLEGKSLQDAIEEKKIFMCNLAILKDLKCKNNRKIAAPIALFYLNNSNDLLPVLIQLQQESSEANSVYTPMDSPNTWLVAKIFYNNAEAQFHQAITHLGFTHLLMEGVSVACHRNLSPSHPIFRLLAPHFLYLIAINKRGEEKLINPGGWVDSTMTQGTEGLFQLMARRFVDWSFDKTNPEAEIKERGLLDPSILPYYPYRDDAVELYQIIRRYVQRVVERYYESPTVIKFDLELQHFRKELTAPFPSGLGLSQVPGNNQEGFTCVEEIVETVSGIISTCSLGHAAANAQQYEQYGFVPNYPGLLTQDPPIEKLEYSEADIVALLPSKEVTLDIVVITNLLSTAITNPLGEFEVQYLHHPKDIQAADKFREELNALSLKIAEKNKKRIRKYDDLNPNYVPNSISI